MPETWTISPVLTETAMTQLLCASKAQNEKRNENGGIGQKWREAIVRYTPSLSVARGLQLRSSIPACVVNASTHVKKRAANARIALAAMVYLTFAVYHNDNIP